MSSLLQLLVTHRIFKSLLTIGGLIKARIEIMQGLEISDDFINSCNKSSRSFNISFVSVNYKDLLKKSIKLIFS